jgi:hypothetical protein
MNPGERQHALAGTLDGWARLTTLQPRQRRALLACYRGLDPRAYSKYGVRRWAAPLPWTRVVVKDPFAVLSITVVVEATGAHPVLVYRHPAAVLASYRRMGWGADWAQIVAMPEFHERRSGPLPAADDEVAVMAEFWRFGNSVALDDLQVLASAGRPGLVVSHAEVAGGGSAAVASLLQALGLPAAPPSGDVPASPSSPPRPDSRHRREFIPDASPEGGPDVSPDASPDASPAPTPPDGVLHDFARDSAATLDGWRRRVSHDEEARLSEIAADVLARLEAERMRFLGPSTDSALARPAPAPERPTL